jgi:hypothetical protein
MQAIIDFNESCKLSPLFPSNLGKPLLLDITLVSIFLLSVVGDGTRSVCPADKKNSTGSVRPCQGDEPDISDDFGGASANVIEVTLQPGVGDQHLPDTTSIAATLLIPLLVSI